jgi:hypothetical protein
MSDFLIQYAGVNLLTAGGVGSVSVGLRPDGIEMAADLAEQEVPRRQGSVVQAARKKSRVIKIVGQVGGATCTRDQIQTVLDAILQATGPESGPQALYAGRDDRFWLAQREACTIAWSDGLAYGVMADVSLAFRAADPDAYASSGLPGLGQVTDALALGASGSTNVTPAGDSTAHPVWSLTIATAASGSITLGNALTGETAIVSGAFHAGDVVTLDSRESTYGASLNGAVDYGIFSGPIPRLWPGVNAVTISLAGLSLSSASLAYCPRYC